MRWLVIAALVVAGCAKKGSSCEGSKQVAMQAIQTAHATVEKDLEASLAVEARLARAKLELGATPAPPELAQQQFDAQTKTAALKLRIATLDSWLATLGGNTPATVSAVPERDEPAQVTTARTLMIAYAAQCTP
jgi:hypothetical protein